jgi:Bax protein
MKRMPVDVKYPFLALLVITLLLTVLAFLHEPAPAPGSLPGPGPAVDMKEIRVEDIAELERTFADHDYHWPPQETVPPLALRHMPARMDRLQVARKKALFFRTVLPLILAENRRILDQRQFLQQALADPEGLSKEQRRRLLAIADEYDVGGNPSDAAIRDRLLRRVDIIPVALALAQAANESAWGSARFTREGNSLFGVWTWQEDRGMVPLRREEGKDHLVRAYPDLRASVRAYMHTLNVGHAYRLFRQKRRAMRLNNGGLNAMELAGLLERYSERGHAYVAEIRRMILGNGLNLLGRLRLAG